MPAAFKSHQSINPRFCLYMKHGSTRPNIDLRLEATIGIRLAATIACRDGSPITSETVLALAVARVAILDSSGEIAEASALMRHDLQDLHVPTTSVKELQTCQTSGLPAPTICGEILREWQSIAAAARQGSRALMAYQILGGHRHRLLFIPLAGRSEVRLNPAVGTPTDGDGPADGLHSGRSVAIVACHTLHADGELLDAELDCVNCDYATLGEFGCLTVRELDALRMLGLGMKLASVARPLHCTVRELGLVLKNLRSKLCASDNFKLAVLAIRSGLVDIDDEQWQRTVFIRST